MEYDVNADMLALLRIRSYVRREKASVDHHLDKPLKLTNSTPYDGGDTDDAFSLARARVKPPLVRAQVLPRPKTATDGSSRVLYRTIARPPPG
jgi:hypothetical protein